MPIYYYLLKHVKFNNIKLLYLKIFLNKHALDK